jgi:hypothetical protein
MQTSHSPYVGQSTSSIAVKLLQAAAEFVGGEKQLALPLGLARPLLGKLMADLHHAADPPLLRAPWTSRLPSLGDPVLAEIRP